MVEIRDILYSFFYVRSRACLRITLTARRTAYLTRAGIALTNAADNTYRGRIKEKAGTGERSQTE